MAHIKYAYNTLVYTGEDIEQGIRRLARYGYDGVEFVGEPEQADAARIRELLDQNGIAASSICAIYTPERDLVSSKADVRKNAVSYLKSCVDFAKTIGAQGISVTPTANMKIHAEADAATEWQWAIESLREAGSYAGEHGIRLAVEAWNRYENYLINRLEQSLALVTDVGLPNVGCMGDTYHRGIPLGGRQTVLCSLRGQQPRRTGTRAYRFQTDRQGAYGYRIQRIHLDGTAAAVRRSIRRSADGRILRPILGRVDHVPEAAVPVHLRGGARI
jgi:hydroxypyruvate isomerase